MLPATATAEDVLALSPEARARAGLFVSFQAPPEMRLRKLSPRMPETAWPAFRPIREALEVVLRLDPAFMQGSADRALGRYYARVPSLLGGSREKAERHLRASLRYNPDSTISRLFLAELMLDQKRPTEARVELQRVIDAPLSDEWAPEDREFKRKAAALLAASR